METLIALALLIVAIWIGFWLFGMALQLFVTVLVGLLIGLAAKAILPGGRSLGWLGTTVAGIVGSMLGGFVGRNILHMDGFLMTTALSVACASGLIALWAPRNRLPPP